MILILSLVYFFHFIIADCPTKNKVDCGIPGTQSGDCKAKGCCWDDSSGPFCSCPSNSYTKYEEKDDANKECFKTKPEGYYFDKNFYKQCYKNCKSCQGQGDDNNNNCIECKNDYYLVSTTKNCVKTCPESYNKYITQKKECIDDCKNDDTYKFEYNNQCYNNCPDGKHEYYDRNDKICYSETPEGYYLDKDSQKYKKCFKNCKTCDQAGNETNHNC